VTFSGGGAAGCDAAQGTVVLNPDGSLTVTVPACAATGPITVTDGMGSATSSQIYTVT
jgi:hypothetical protein